MSSTDHGPTYLPSEGDGLLQNVVSELLAGGQSPTDSSALQRNKPLVAQLEGRDCTIEVKILKSVATVAFCDASKFDEIHERVLQDAKGVFLWDEIQLGRNELALFRSLKCIVKLGNGLNNIDWKAAGEMGIAVCQVTGYGIEEAADSTLCLVLDLLRKPITLDAAFQMRNPSCMTTDAGPPKVEVGCERIRGKTLGIVGLGRVGKAVAIRARVFGLKVIVFDPYLEDGYDRTFGVTQVGKLTDLLSQSDCVTLHCGLNNLNYCFINKEALAFMRPTAALVNIKNRNLVDEAALAEALTSGQLRAAAMDAYLGTPNWGPLNYVPNLILTPRTAYISEMSLKEFGEAAALEMKTFLEEGVESMSISRLRHLKNRNLLFQI